MPTKKQVGASKLYANLMAEVRIRMTSIETACKGQTGIASPLIKEFCFLQLRMTCELIALGNLAHNVTFPQTEISLSTGLSGHR